MLTCLDILLIIGYSKIRDQWELIRRVDRVAGHSPESIREVKIVQTGWLEMPLVVQNGEIIRPEMRIEEQEIQEN